MKPLQPFILAALCALAFFPTGYGQSVPPLINYQGRLTDEAGSPLSNGTYRVAFRLWSDPASPSTNNPNHLIWGAEHDVTLVGGAFNVILGAPGGVVVPGAAVNDVAFAFTDSNRFLGLTLTRLAERSIIAPVSQREILPRQQILSTPFALVAQQARQAQIASALTSELADALCPPGSIMPFGGTNIPSGWLLCDGRAVSSEQYPRLYGAITTNWGGGVVGNTNNFNLPDLRGMFLRGFTGSRTDSFADPDRASRSSSTNGGATGNDVGSVQSDVVGQHRHYLTGSGGLQPGGPYSTPFGADFTSTWAVTATGPGIGSETRPKNAYVNFIIKY